MFAFFKFYKYPCYNQLFIFALLMILILLICNCLSSPGSCPGQSSVRGPSGLQYEINLVIIQSVECYF